MSKVKATIKDVSFDRGVGSIAIQKAPHYKLPERKGVITAKGAAVPNMVGELFAKNLTAPWEVVDEPKVDLSADVVNPLEFDQMAVECAGFLADHEAHGVLKSLAEDRDLIKKCINLLRKA